MPVHHRCLASLGRSAYRQPTCIQGPRFELELFDFGMQRGGSPFQVPGQHLREHGLTVLEHTFDRNSEYQSSFNATALGVTFIFGSYSATSTTRPSPTNLARSSVRHDSHGP